MSRGYYITSRLPVLNLSTFTSINVSIIIKKNILKHQKLLFLCQKIYSVSRKYFPLHFKILRKLSNKLTIIETCRQKWIRRRQVKKFQKILYIKKHILCLVLQSTLVILYSFIIQQDLKRETNFDLSPEDSVRDASRQQE